MNDRYLFSRIASKQHHDRNRRINQKREMLSCIFFAISFCLVLVCPAISIGSDTVHAKHVLILHSYYQGYKWTDDENAGIASILEPVIGRTNFVIEYMDTKKIFGDLYARRLFEVYKLKYRHFKFDLIMTTDNNAFDFMRKYRDDLFRGTPVVFCGVNNLQASDLKSHRLFTGVNERTDLKASIQLIMKLHPKTRHIVFINEWTSTGQRVHDEFLEAMQHFQNTVAFSLLEQVTLKELVEQLEALKEGSVVLYTSFSRDKSGKVLAYDESASIISAHCKVPIYTTHEFNLGLGVIGGLVSRGFDQGEAGAKLALRILNGERPEDIPVVMESPNRYMFDYRQLTRFHIPIRELPGSSTIVNLPQSFYFRYKQLVLTLAGIFIVLLSIISTLLINIRKRKRTERELKISREQLRTLAWRLAETEEKERKALSRELHDEIGQNLTILTVNLNLMKSDIPQDISDFTNIHINDSLAVIKQMHERVRALMNNLRSPVLDDYGLLAAIDLYAKQYSARTGINVRIRKLQEDVQLSPDVENALFRIIQEALTNVVKHAQATQVVINAVSSKGKFTLTIEDNGIGCDMVKAAKADSEHGWGLVTMAERAMAVGGNCRIKSKPGFGTHVITEVPI